MNELDASRHSAWHLFEDKTDEEISEFTGLPMGVVVSAMQNLLGQERHFLRKISQQDIQIHYNHNFYPNFRNLDVEFHNWLCTKYKLKHMAYWNKINNFDTADFLEFLSESTYEDEKKNFFTMNPLLLNFLPDELALEIVFLNTDKGVSKLKYFENIVVKLRDGLGPGEAIVDTAYWEG